MASSFILVDQVENLDYNFTPYGDSGTIPEPSGEQINSFRKGVAAVMAEALGEDEKIEEGSQEWARRVVDVLGKDTAEIQEKMLHVIAEVCSDKPSFDDLKKLPYRAQQAFSGWVMGMFLLPSTPTLGTNS